MRGGHGVAVAAVLALAGRSPAVGTIQTTGATIAVGDSPNPGALLIDPAAPGTPPVLPSPGTPGPAPAMTGSMPAFPGGGTGADGSLTVSADTTLAAGTYNYTSLTIQNLATLTYDGAVTLLVQGDADIDGALSTSASGASITLRCGGRFRLLSDGAQTTLVQTMGSNAPISIAAGKGLFVGTGVAGAMSKIDAASGNVDLQANGTVSGQSGISVISGEVLAPAGSITIRSAAEVTLGGSTSNTHGYAYANGGPVLVQAFGAFLTVGAYGKVDAQDGQEHTLESAGRIDFGGYTFGGGGSHVTLLAVAGPLSIDGSVAASGDVSLLSGGGITITGNDQEISCYGGGSITVEATGGDVSFGGPDCRIDGSSAPVTVKASGSVHMTDNYDIMCLSLLACAQGGDLTMKDTPSIKAYGGPIALRASNKVYVGMPALGGSQWKPSGTSVRFVSVGTDPSLDGDTVDLTAGDGGVICDAAFARSVNGAFTVLAQGPVAIARSITAHGSVLVSSLGGDVDVVQATITSGDDSEADTGSVTVESWVPFGTIAADGATIRSGNVNAASSGDVSLLVHLGGPAAPAIESFVLPRKIKVRLDGTDAAKSTLLASGFLDTGPDADPSLAAAATVTLGDLSIPVAGLVPDASGTKFTYADAGLLFQVKASKTGSSRAIFRVKYEGDLSGKVDPDAPVTLSFDNGTVDGTGRVGLQAGVYALGKKRGSLVAPNLYLYRAKAALKGAGMDGLTLKAGIATGGTTPETAPAVTVGFGDTFSRTIPSGSFVRNGDRYEFHGDQGGINLVVLDYLRESVTVKGGGLDLGDFGAGPVPVLVTVGIGGDIRSVRVRMGRKGTGLVY